jgi:alkylation response protein AidB-like acyl-CoA dehydrogenase
MDFEYSEEQQEWREQVRAFAREVIGPEALKYDQKGVFPKKTVRRMGERGLFAVIVPKAYSGLGLSTLEYGLVQQEVARFSPAYTHNGQYQVQKALMLFGTEAQKQRYLPKLAMGTYSGAIAISEHHAGSSLKKMETTAERKGDAYILNGHKTHINDAAEAHIMVLLARTGKGMSAFILENDTPGVTFEKKLNPIGFRASPMYEFTLENVRIPQSQRLGEEGKGLRVFFGVFDFSRIGNASTFIGIARGSIEAAMEYARQRDVGGSRVTEFQGIRWVFADLFTKIEAAELLRNKAALLEASGSPCAKETCMAKYFAGEVAKEATNKAIEITGSYGCYREQPFDMLCRDAKSLLIAGGSSEIMKNVIADLTIEK